MKISGNWIIAAAALVLVAIVGGFAEAQENRDWYRFDVVSIKRGQHTENLVCSQLKDGTDSATQSRNLGELRTKAKSDASLRGPVRQKITAEFRNVTVRKGEKVVYKVFGETKEVVAESDGTLKISFQTTSWAEDIYLPFKMFNEKTVYEVSGGPWKYPCQSLTAYASKDGRPAELWAIADRAVAKNFMPYTYLIIVP